MMHDWNSFWDLASPQQAAVIITEIYGSAAGKEALSCALAAESDNRDEDYRFWIAVLARVRANNSLKHNFGATDPSQEIRVALPVHTL